MPRHRRWKLVQLILQVLKTFINTKNYKMYWNILYAQNPIIYIYKHNTGQNIIKYSKLEHFIGWGTYLWLLTINIILFHVLF